MPFTASQPTTCIKCQGLIPKGEPISWTRGKGAQPGVYHFACPSEVPVAVTFDTLVAADEPEPYLPEADDDLPPMPELPREPIPGSRKWLERATMSDREQALVNAVENGMTFRAFRKAVRLYGGHLNTQEFARFKRFARGVWAGVTLSVDDTAAEENRAQMELDYWAHLRAPYESVKLGEDTQAWRTIVAEWNGT